MAKKSFRSLLLLRCSICKSQNYITIKNKNNTIDSLSLQKYCKVCRKRTIHKEYKKLD